MATINTIQVYDLNGASTDFPVAFEYLARKFVQVTLLGADRRPLTLVTEFVFTNSSTIRTLTAWGPAQGYTQIEVRRVTSATERLVNFNDATILRAGDLNLAELQSIHIAEEARNSIADVLGLDGNGNLDARFRRIVNIADPEGPNDAVNLQSMNREYNGIFTAAANAVTASGQALTVAQEALVTVHQYTDNAARFDTVADMMSFSPIRKTYALVAEYSAGFGPGGGGHFTWFPLSTEPHDGIVVFRSVSNPDVGRWIRSNYTDLNVKMAGAAWNGSRNDTIRTQAFLDYCKAKGIRAVLPPGTGRLERLYVKGSMFNFDIVAQGCYLEAMSNVPEDGLLNIINCVDVSLSGEWRWNGADNPNYRCMVSFHAITAEPGAGSQAVTRIKMIGHTFRNCAIGIAVGDYAVDYQCSEINILNTDWFACPQPMYIGGSNAGFQVFGNVTSERNTAFPGVTECAVRQEGGFFKVFGSLVTNPTAQAGIVSTPCSSALYGGSLYGTSTVTGAHTEVNSPLVELSNPRGLGNVSSIYANHMFLGCTGYAGGDVSRDFIYVGDVTYAGTIGVLGCNYYNPAGRTGYNMSGISPLVRFITDSVSWGEGFGNWLGGIGYGRVVHGVVPVVKVTGMNQVFNNGVETVMKFQYRDLDNELLFYAHLYDTAGGTFLVPPGGFTHLSIDCSVLAYAAGITGVDMWIELNGVPVAFGSWAGGIVQLSTVLTNLNNGDILRLKMKTFGATVTVSSDRINFLAITGATR